MRPFAVSSSVVIAYYGSFLFLASDHISNNYFYTSERSGTRGTFLLEGMKEHRIRNLPVSAHRGGTTEVHRVTRSFFYAETKQAFEDILQHYEELAGKKLDIQ